MTHLDEVFDHPLTRKERRLLKKKTNRAERRSNGGQQQGPKFGGLELKRIFPKTANQEKIFDCFEHEENILVMGVPGAGKTFILAYLCLNEIINNPDSDFKKLIIVRSAVPTRDIGFLPGNAKDKMAEYEAPYVDICAKLFGRADAYSILKKMNIIEFMPTSFVRGITLDNCFVIVDEFSNLTGHENASIITRLGDLTRIYFAGDFNQSDHKYKDEKDGMIKFIEVVKCMKSFGVIEMGIDDIVRGRIVREFIIEAMKKGLI